MKINLLIFLLCLGITGNGVESTRKRGESTVKNKKSNGLQRDIYFSSEKKCEHSGLCPEFFNFCAEPKIFEETRKIPKIRNEKLFESLELIQVQSIIRHGARTPTKYHKCWEGMNQSWNCDELITTVQAAAFDMKNKTQTLEFSKHYDIRQWENNLNGTCKMGQLILQGYEQHRINGKLMARAYFKPNDNLVSRNGLNIGTDYRKEIYVRSSDMQRTTVSAAALLTSLLEEVIGKEETFGFFQKFPLHTMDIQSDYLFANSNVENITDYLRSALNSKSYFGIVEEHQSLYKELETKIRTPQLKDLWPGDIMDCIMTTICTGNHDKLPNGFMENNLLNRTISAIEKELSLIYTWNDSILSKSEMSRLLFDIRDYILDIILHNESQKNGLINIKRVCSRNSKSGYKGGTEKNFGFEFGFGHALDLVSQTQTSDDLLYFLTPLCLKIENDLENTNNKIGIKVPKFILYSGHDTTIIPTLASLQIWDEHWPPYASTFIIEVYHNPSDFSGSLHNYFKDDNMDEIQDLLPYYVRLLYNGVVITDKLDECHGNELCHISSFFKRSKFAQQKKTIKKEGFSFKEHEAKGSEGPSNTDKIAIEMLNENPNGAEYIVWFLIGFTTCIILLYVLKGVRFIVSILSGFNTNSNINNQGNNNYQAL
ncbi:Histidine phosphatase superfamily (branch 2) family protein [Cryptosporidium felis]|nr:Histidine phosphatase superfamily (branch 2) family protein [Cryptosporidium felis]